MKEMFHKARRLTMMVVGGAYMVVSIWLTAMVVLVVVSGCGIALITRPVISIPVLVALALLFKRFPLLLEWLMATVVFIVGTSIALCLLLLVVGAIVNMGPWFAALLVGGGILLWILKNPTRGHPPS